MDERHRALYPESTKRRNAGVAMWVGLALCGLWLYGVIPLALTQCRARSDIQINEESRVIGRGVYDGSVREAVEKVSGELFTIVQSRERGFG